MCVQLCGLWLRFLCINADVKLPNKSVHRLSSGVELHVHILTQTASSNMGVNIWGSIPEVKGHPIYLAPSGWVQGQAILFI